MTDRELLEAAAKVAGIDIEFHGDMPWLASGKRPWVPLTDDGDALRLAVKLDIVPRVINGAAFAWRDGVCDELVPVGDDPLAATRRAIVRAAASIGGGREG